MAERLPRPIHFWLDKELGLLHTRVDCQELKMAKKYNYVESVTVTTKEGARLLDRRSRPCPRCKKEEERKRKGGPKQFRYTRRRNPQSGE